MIKSERYVELQVHNEELESEIDELENLNSILEQEIKRVRLENQTLKKEIAENKNVIDIFTKNI